ncbi:MAG TPA: hypothetical protein VFI69_04725 [Candidatus Limnocylindrales bacterium]|nr:hypothetical protein [Candidatus Limnocylindrales bacterium]
MLRSIRLGAIAAIAAATVIAGSLIVATPAADAAKPGTIDRQTFHDTMRALWEDHIVWTRQYIVSAATLSTDLPDIGPTTDRLLANQTDLGDAFRPFYGDAVGDAVTGLLRDHILTAARLIAAAKAGDATEVDAVSAAWYANGDDIAAALNGINPGQWDLGHMQAMMRAHLDRTLEEAVARLQGRYADDIAAYAAVHADILTMADMLSDGIIAQFPKRFAR